MVNLKNKDFAGLSWKTVVFGPFFIEVIFLFGHVKTISAYKNGELRLIKLFSWGAK